MEDTYAFELRSYIDYLEGEYKEAVNHIRNAIKCNTDEKRKKILLEDEARYLFELSKVCDNQLDHEKAINDLPETSRVKWELIYKKNNWEISHFGTDPILKTVLQSRRKFENIEYERRLFAIEQKRKKGKDEFRDSANDVIDKSKQLLEFSMNSINEAMYPGNRQHCSFPNLDKCKNNKQRVAELNKLLKKYNWNDFESNSKSLFDMFITKLDINTYRWLAEFRKIRNSKQHPRELKDLDGDAILGDDYNKTTKLVRNVSNYAADFWKTVNYHINMFKLAKSI